MTNDIILVYGSYAKGEANDNSDIDVLVITDNIKKNFLELEVFKNMAINMGKIDLKIMSRKNFLKLVEINSLFVHHLKECSMFLEGAEEFLSITSKLGRYIIPKSEVVKLVDLANDCLRSIDKIGINIFDLSILFTFLRNAIILLNYKNGALEFNKFKILSMYESNDKFVNIREVYFLCYDAKLKYNRNIPKIRLFERWSDNMKKTIKNFINKFLEGMHNENRRDS